MALVSLIIGYGIGTSVLQTAYQKGDALTAAGTATMVTNAVPIAAGFVLFGETLPHGIRAVAQVMAFALPHPERGRPRAPGRAERSRRPRPERRPSRAPAPDAEPAGESPPA